MSLSQLCAASVTAGALSFGAVTGLASPANATTGMALHVVDSTGRSIPGATVSIVKLASEKSIRQMRVGQSYQPHIVAKGATNDGGRFHTGSSLNPGSNSSLEMRVSAPGYTEVNRFFTHSQLIKLSSRSSNSTPSDVTVELKSTNTTRASSAPTYGAVRYTKLAESGPAVTLGQLRSATSKGVAALKFTASGTATLGVGIKFSYKGQVSFSQQATRTIDSGVEIPLAPLVGVGTKMARTKGYYVKWRLRQKVVYWQGDRPIVKDRQWEEWRPEGFNGGDLSTTSRKRPSTKGINVSTRCSGKIKYGLGNSVTRGVASTTLKGASIAGVVNLTSRAGYSQAVRVTVKPRKREQTVRVCGYFGSALSNPGRTVVIG